MSIQKGFSKRDFSCGQYDREYQAAQTDISSRGMIFSRNLISSPLREIKTRPGTKLLKVIGPNSKVIPFRNPVTNNDDYLLAQEGSFSILSMRDGQLVPYVSNAVSRILDTWNSNTSSSGIKISGTFWNSSVNGNYYEMFKKNSAGVEFDWETQTASLRPDADFWGWQVSSASPGVPTYSFAEFVFEFPAETTLSKLVFNFMNIYSWTTTTDRRSIGAALLDPQIAYSDDGENWTYVATSAGGLNGESNYTESAFGGNAINNQQWSYNNRRMRITNAVDTSKHLYWKVRFSNTQQVLNVQKNQNWKFVVGLNLYTQTSGSDADIFPNDFSVSDLDNIKYAQQDETLIITALGKKPKKVELSAGAYTISDFTPSGTPTFWDTQGYPSAVTFFSNRLWFGGFSLKPNRVCGSAFDNYDDFTVPDTILASSPIIADCNQMKSKITDLFGGWDVLYVQCDEGIATIESGDAAIAPNNMSFLLKVHRRSSGITPTIKENMMFWVGKEKNLIYAIQYDIIARKFQVADVSKFAHSYLQSGISEIHYVDTNARLIYGNLKNGNMFALLYDEQAAVIGLFPMETAGQVTDLSVVQYESEVRLVGVINRDSYFTLEMFNPVRDLEGTTEFEQSRYMANLATKRNLISQPFVDCAVSIKDERPELWQFNTETQTLSFQDGSGEHTDFSTNAQDVIRFFTAEDVIYDLKIVGSPEPNIYKVEVVTGDAGQDAIFVRLRMPLNNLTPELNIPNQQYQYFDSGQYLGSVVSDENGILVFKNPVYDLIYGFAYRKIGVIQDNMTYLRKKKWGTVALSVMDTMALQIGVKLDKMDNVMKWMGTDFYNSSPIMRNGILIKNISDSPENDKQLIFKTDEGLPFCIRAIEAGGEITDRNQN